MATTLTTGEAAVAGAAIGGALIFVALISLAVAVLGIIAGWKIFKKAGQPGWKILIPVYNAYIFFKIVGMNFWGWFAALLGCSLAYGLFGGVTVTGVTETATGVYFNMNMNVIGWIFYIAEFVLTIVMAAIFSKRLATAFKKSTGFAVGLFFLSLIFEMILAFGPAKYDKKAALKK